MGLRQIQSPWVTDVIATTDATPTISSSTSFAVPSGAKGYVHIRGWVYSATLVATVDIKIPFRNIAGTLTLLTILPILGGATGTPLGDAALLTSIFDATKSGTTIQPRVTGIAATNLTFVLDVRYHLD